MQLADAGRSPGGESSWPELVNIANGVSCSNTQQHHWSRQWDRAPGVTVAYCCSFGFEHVWTFFGGPTFNSVRNFAQCDAVRHYTKKLSATRWHGVRLHLTTLASISNTMSIQVVIVCNCGILWSRAGPLTCHAEKPLQLYKAWELRQSSTDRIGWTSFHDATTPLSWTAVTIRPCPNLMTSGRFMAVWYGLIMLHNSAWALPIGG